MSSEDRQSLLSLQEQIAELTSKESRIELIRAFIKQRSNAVQIENVSSIPSSDAIQRAKNAAAKRALLNSVLAISTEAGLSIHEIFPSEQKQSEAIGSGVNGAPLSYMICCRFDVRQRLQPCTKKAVSTCGQCKLVAYCSEECQKQHWPYHKQDCKESPLVKDWKPQWEEEERLPNFMSDDNITAKTFGLCEYLWGNMPAIDVLNLPKNELSSPNISAKQPLRLLFAASGDLRDVIRTVNRLPKQFTGELDIYINDRNPMVAARNLLLLTLLADDEKQEQGDRFIDCAIAAWYQIAMTEAQGVVLTEHVHRLLGSCKPMFTQSLASCRMGKSSVFCKPSMKQAILLLTEMQKAILSTTLDSANLAYGTVMMNRARVDYRSRHMLKMQPFKRLAWFDRRQYGLLLPFGAYNAHHNYPNLFILHPKYGFTQNDSADPLCGWPIEEVRECGTRHRCPSNDEGGAMFFYVREQLVQFIGQLRKYSIRFHLSCDDAEDLPVTLGEHFKFDRIFVSNISDKTYLGIARVLSILSPMLNSENPNATLIALFMNWVCGVSGLAELPSMQHIGKHVEERAKSLRLKQLTRWSIATAFELAYPGLTDALATDFWSEFSKWLTENLDKADSKAGVVSQERTSIVPRRLGVPVGAPPETLPKESLVYYGASGIEVYTEWRLEPKIS